MNQADDFSLSRHFTYRKDTLTHFEPKLPLREENCSLNALDDVPDETRMILLFSKDHLAATCSEDDQSNYSSNVSSRVAESDNEGDSFYTAYSSLESQQLAGINGVDQAIAESERPDNIDYDDETLTEQNIGLPISNEDHSNKIEDCSAVAYRVDTNRLEPDYQVKSESLDYRCVFKKYWKSQERMVETAVSPHILISTPAPQVRRTEQADIIAKESINRSAFIRRHPQDRRRIFSENCFIRHNSSFDGKDIKNTEESDEPKSSLRHCRYSGEFRRTSNSSLAMKHSVSFSEQTKITLYKKPIEQYENEGWEELFR